MQHANSFLLLFFNLKIFNFLLVFFVGQISFSVANPAYKEDVLCAGYDLYLKTSVIILS
jgi:hypothetical protein